MVNVTQGVLGIEGTEAHIRDGCSCPENMVEIKRRNPEEYNGAW
jgi:hypothetical protein